MARGKHANIKKEAQRWLLDGGDDFSTVCAAATVPEEAIQKFARRLCKGDQKAREQLIEWRDSFAKQTRKHPDDMEIEPNPMFRSKFSEDIFNNKYAHENATTWAELARTLVEDVCMEEMPKDEREELIEHITQLRFVPGGRYLYYAGRKRKFFNNCFLLRAEEDTREDWANLSWKAESCLMTGGGIGVDYSVYRPAGSALGGTGGTASGAVTKMRMINEIGRSVMQGGSRRSAIYASLNWQHGDIKEFLNAKNWHNMPVGQTGKTMFDIKQEDFNFPCAPRLHKHQC